MTAPLLTSRIPRGAAKPRLAASSVAPVASSYERSLRPRDFSRMGNAIRSKGGR